MCQQSSVVNFCQGDFFVLDRYVCLIWIENKYFRLDRSYVVNGGVGIMWALNTKHMDPKKKIYDICPKLCFHCYKYMDEQ